MWPQIDVSTVGVAIEVLTDSSPIRMLKVKLLTRDAVRSPLVIRHDYHTTYFTAIVPRSQDLERL